MNSFGFHCFFNGFECFMLFFHHFSMDFNELQLWSPTSIWPLYSPPPLRHWALCGGFRSHTNAPRGRFERRARPRSQGDLCYRTHHLVYHMHFPDVHNMCNVSAHAFQKSPISVFAFSYFLSIWLMRHILFIVRRVS